ncbi:taste receptor type 2 member 19-like [Ctenodactylus gundi]
MKSLLESILTIIATAEFAVGNFANGFIATVNCANWVRRRRISSADWILTALAISRIGLLCVMLMHLFLGVFKPAFFSSEEKIIILIAWAITHHFSAWLAASLSMIYLLKVVNFSNPSFLQLKKRVEHVIGVILLGTLVLLFSNIATTKMHTTLGVNEYAGNVTWKTKFRDAVDIVSMTVFDLMIITPFLTSLICVLLLMFSLCKHLRKMRLHGKGSQDPSTRAHVKALQMVVSFLLLFAMYSLIMLAWNSTQLPDTLTHFHFLVVVMLYPSSHSCVLIWGNRKLHQTFVSLLWQARCWLKEWKTPTP